MKLLIAVLVLFLMLAQLALSAPVASDLADDASALKPRAPAPQVSRVPGKTKKRSPNPKGYTLKQAKIKRRAAQASTPVSGGGEIGLEPVGARPSKRATRKL